MDSSTLLAAEDLHRSFHKGKHEVKVLANLHLEVTRGEKVFLCGASGAGKTTLLYTLAGLERPDSGTVWIGGEPFYQTSVRKQARLRNRVMGYVFQHYCLLQDLTALENVLLPAMIAKKESRPQAEELLRRVGLADRMQHLPTELSGGEQQRVAIARALINDPQILFADEPTGNLDFKTGGEVVEALLRVVNEQEKTLVVVTHDAKLAQLGDRKLTLEDGALHD